VQFSPDSCGLLPLGAKYFPQRIVVMQPQSTLFPPHDRGCTTPTKKGGKFIFLRRIWTPDGKKNDSALQCNTLCPKSTVLPSSNQLNLDRFHSNKFEIFQIFKENQLFFLLRIN
jgi:hypothetical protein